MNKLQKFAELYNTLIDKEFTISIDATQKTSSFEIKLNFSPEHFHHLLGIGKLADIEIARMNRVKFFKEALDGKTTYDNLKESVYFADIEERFSYFQHYIDVLHNEIVLNFDRRKAYYCTIKSDLMFFKIVEGTYVHSFFQSNDTDIYIPVTFFPRANRDYIERQKVFRISDVKITSRPPQKVSIKDHIRSATETARKVNQKDTALKKLKNEVEH